MSKIPKVDRKALKGPDEFVKSGQKIFNFIVGQRSRFVPVLAVGAVVVVGVYLYDWWSQSRLEKAWDTYNVAIKADEKDRWTKLKEAYPKIEGTRPGEFAAVALADHHFDEAKKEALQDSSKALPSATESSEWYKKALSFSSLLSAERQLLLVNLGQSYELSKKYDEALKEYETAQATPGDAKGLVLLSQARVQELKGDKNKALETYEKVAQDFSSTEYGKVAKNHLRRLKGNLFQAKGR